jgi:Zn-finger nucleic acid-binding protein
VGDETDRFGRMLDRAEKAREDQWARERDEEILKRLRDKYTKHINCPVCGVQLDPRAAIGFGGMACPRRDGAWADPDTIEKVRARLHNAAAIHSEGIGERVYGALDQVIAGLRKKHEKGINCPECGLPLDPRAESGLGGMACPNRHGVWLDRDVLEQIRARLDEAHGKPPRTIE